MSSLIEQAALRLQQLRQAGITVPEVEPVPGADAAPPSPAAPPAGAAPVAASPSKSTGPVGKTPASPTGEAAVTVKRIELDLARLGVQGIVTPNAPRSRLADQYRVIKRPLIANATAKGASAITHGNLIMVTSALSGEGKSFTSVNLAMSIAAELDHTVMLVDADVARPSVLRMLGQAPGPGLLDILEGKADVASVLLRTNVDKLTILPSGSPHPKATELLASEAMRALLDDLATRYPDRIIIFDSPPLLLTTEARVLASHMGQIVVVVRADETLQATVHNALSTIETCPLKMVVLNQARGDAQGSYGSNHGHTYGEAYGYGQDPAVSATAAAPAVPAAGKRAWFGRKAGAESAPSAPETSNKG